MRLWHPFFIPAMDEFHIVAQWRELIAIKGAIIKNGTPNHRLVNKVLDYSIDAFKTYTNLVASELSKRRIKYNQNRLQEINKWECPLFGTESDYKIDWFNFRYLTQCYYNLQEKFDCGIVSLEAWKRIKEQYQLADIKIHSYTDD